MTTDEDRLAIRLKDAVTAVPDDLTAAILARPEFEPARTPVRTQRIRRLPVAIAAMTVAAVVVAGWWVAHPATPSTATGPMTPSVSSATAATPTSTPTPAVRPDDLLIANPQLSVGDGQQGIACDGVPGQFPKDRKYFLNPAATVVSGVVCFEDTRYVPGQGVWDGIAERAMTADEVAAIRQDLLAAADRAVKTPRQTGCDLVLRMVPSFVLATPADTKIRPFIPGYDCQSIGGAPDLLFSILSSSPVTGFSPVTQISTDAMATAGCFAAQQVGPDPLQDEKHYQQHPALPRYTGPLPATGSELVSVCHYSPPYSLQVHVVATGLPGASANDLWRSASTTPPTGCASRAAQAGPAVGGWIAVVPTPSTTSQQKPSDRPVFLGIVELGGCHRILNSRQELAGYADPSVLNKLLQ